MGQQPNKYHISDDGKVYRINDDGSFTKIGNVEDIENKPDRHIPPPAPPTFSNFQHIRNRNKNGKTILWVVLLIILLFLFFTVLVLIYQDNITMSHNKYNPAIPTCDTDSTCNYEEEYVDSLGEYY